MALVQGMSGSPIIQNGKIVGAVTHVFLNDPTREDMAFCREYGRESWFQWNKSLCKKPPKKLFSTILFVEYSYFSPNLKI